MLAGKTIVVTGAASGIGAQTCEELQMQGAAVIGVDRNKCDNVDQQFTAHLSDPHSIKELVSALPANLNGLANVAGLPPTASAEAVLKVNFLGLRQFTLGLVEKLAHGASIVNLSSLAGFGWPDELEQIRELLALELDDDVQGFCASHGLDSPGGRSYFLSKEALSVWAIQQRWSWRDRGISMNNVSPGPVDTPILGDFIETLGARAEEDMKVMDRPGHPRDIAPVVAFLLSDGAKWFRGANLTLDGGMSGHILSNIHSL